MCNIKALSIARNMIRLNFCMHRRSCDRCRFHYAYKSCAINIDEKDRVIINKTISRLIDEYCMYCSDISRNCPMCRYTEYTGGCCTINSYMKHVKCNKDMGRGVL